jgi:hypothetical protein
VAALAVTTGAAVVQTRPTSEALATRRLAAASDPAQQVCQRRGPAVYCVYPGFEPQIGLWEPTVRAVLAGVPPAAAARAVPVTVAQRIGWPRLFAEEAILTAEEDPARGRPPVASVGTAWGRDGLTLAQARLAANVAARLTGLTRPEPPPGSELARWNAPCQAHGVVALWLAGQATPHAAEGLRQGIADVYGGIFTLVHDVDPDDLWWGERAGRFALALLDRPRDQVAQALWRNWDLVTSPETTIERLGEVLGMQPPPPGSPNPSDSGGPAC